MNEKSVYRVPPKLTGKFLLGGLYTLYEMIAIILTGFFAISFATKGISLPLLVPAAFVTICFRPFSERTIGQLLMVRINFYREEQEFGLQECKRIWQQK